jgi:UDPglucose 6-dehydrogenase
MKISIIGTGYVGLVQGACFADAGNRVVCMDIDRQRIENLERGQAPFFEPGLEEVIRRNTGQGRLRFTTSLRNAIEESDLIFLCLPTPQASDGSADVKSILGVAAEIAKLANGPKILISKSTVPVGTTDKIKQLVSQHAKQEIAVASNPEFLKEGSAVEDTMKPDRVVIGTTSMKVISALTELYAPFIRHGAPILVMNEKSAEMVKYAANAFLATRVSFINEIANLCEAVGANVDEVRKGIGVDPRIGALFMSAGVGFGGSCLPKDVKALVKTGEEFGVDLRVVRAVEEVNELQKRRLVQKMSEYFGGNLSGKRIALWGLSFKPKTDDIRAAPSLIIIDSLLKEGASVCAHDPVALPAVRLVYNSKVEYFEDRYDVLKDADALVVVTEWQEFRSPDLAKMKELMKQPVVFDGRNIFDPKSMTEQSFIYFSVGRG